MTQLLLLEAGIKGRREMDTRNEVANVVLVVVVVVVVVDDNTSTKLDRGATGRCSSKHRASGLHWRRVLPWNGGDGDGVVIAALCFSVVAGLLTCHLTWAIGSPTNSDATFSKNP